MPHDVTVAIDEAAVEVRRRAKLAPEVGIVLGTGLGDFAGALEVAGVIPYAEIPGFPVSTVDGHAGELHVGRLGGRPVAVLRGRTHYYEGYSMQQVVFPVRVLGALGCRTLILTSACGAMNPNLPTGSVVLTVDHINLTGDSPLIGPNDERLGPRFPDMSEPYSRRLIALAERIGLEQGMALPRAVYAGVAGPNLETPAEYRFLRAIGADVVGMSVVPETIAAVHARQKVLAINVVTDACLPDNLHPVDIAEVMRIAGEAAPRLIRLITEVVRRLDEAA